MRICSIVLCLLLLTGCSKLTAVRNQPEYTVSVVLKALNSHYWLDMRAGMQQAAEELEIDLRLLYPSGELENEEQKALLEDALQADTDLLLFAPCDSYDTQWVAARAQAEQIPVLTVDTRALDADLPYIGPDNEQIGHLAADYLSDNLQPGASVVVMAGSDRQASHIDRIQALQNALNPSITITEIVYTDMTQFAGYQTMKQMADQSFDAVFCANAVIGLGVATGLAEMGRDLPVIAVDTQMDALQALQDGAMDALLSQDGYEIGYQAICTAVQTLRTGALPENIYFTSELLEN